MKGHRWRISQMQNQRDPCEFRARHPGPALGQHPSEDAHIPRSPFLFSLGFHSTDMFGLQLVTSIWSLPLV